MRANELSGRSPASGPSLRPFSARNIPAYLAVMAVWLVAAAVIAGVAERVFDAKPTIVGFGVLALVSVLAGMAIMFTASLLNLAKMRAGLSRLAEGDTNSRIPPVWCPVLTAATHAITSCARRLGGARETTPGPVTNTPPKARSPR